MLSSPSQGSGLRFRVIQLCINDSQGTKVGAVGGRSPLQDSLSTGPSLSLHDRTLVPSLVPHLSVTPPVQSEDMNVTGGHGCVRYFLCEEEIMGFLQRAWRWTSRRWSSLPSGHEPHFLSLASLVVHTDSQH